MLAALKRVGLRGHAPMLDRAHYAGMVAHDRCPYSDHHAWRDYMTAYARLAGVPEDRLAVAVDELFAAQVPWSEIPAGSVDALHALAATGVVLAIVSNSDGTLEARLRARGVCQVGPGAGAAVKAVVDSAVVGLRKPDPAIFELALRATGAQPARTLHVGDSVHYDVVGARAAGIRALHLDPFDLCRRDGHEHLQALDDLLPLVID